MIITEKNLSAILSQKFSLKAATIYFTTNSYFFLVQGLSLIRLIIFNHYAKSWLYLFMIFELMSSNLLSGVCV